MTKSTDMFISKANGELALRIANWLTTRDYGCAIRQTDDGVVTITYGENHGEGHIWPSIRINAGKVTFPAGSPVDLTWEVLDHI